MLPHFFFFNFDQCYKHCLLLLHTRLGKIARVFECKCGLWFDVPNCSSLPMTQLYIRQVGSNNQPNSVVYQNGWTKSQNTKSCTNSVLIAFHFRILGDSFIYSVHNSSPNWGILKPILQKVRSSWMDTNFKSFSSFLLYCPAESCENVIHMGLNNVPTMLHHQTTCICFSSCYFRYAIFLYFLYLVCRIKVSVFW